MADSVGSGFPSTGINKGHIFYDFDESSMWMYLGGIPKLASSWVLLYGRLTTQPDTTLWGVAQAGAMWFLNGVYYGWDGAAIVEILSTGPLEIGTSLRIIEDFVSGSNSTGAIGTYGWNTQNGIAFSIGGEDNHPGILERLTTGAGVVTGLRLNIITGSLNISILIPFTCVFVSRVNGVSGNETYRFGLLGNTQLDPPVDGIYFEKLTADTNWFIVSIAASVETRVATGVSVDEVFHKFSIYRTASTIVFKIDNVVVGTITTNLPQTRGDLGGHVISANGAAQSWDIDYIYFNQTGISR